MAKGKVGVERMLVASDLVTVTAEWLLEAVAANEENNCLLSCQPMRPIEWSNQGLSVSPLDPILYV